MNNLAPHTGAPYRHGEHKMPFVFPFHALRAPKIKESLGSLGFPVVGSTPKQFAAWLRSDLESHKKMLDSGAVKLQ